MQLQLGAPVLPRPLAQLLVPPAAAAGGWLSTPLAVQQQAPRRGPACSRFLHRLLGRGVWFAMLVGGGSMLVLLHE